MNKIRLTIVALFGLTVLSTSIFADVKKGQEVYLKILKAKCGFSGANFAIQHTQDEWEDIKQAGKFGDEVSKICPKATLERKYETDVYDFSYKYAKDSGNVPSC